MTTAYFCNITTLRIILKQSETCERNTISPLQPNWSRHQMDVVFNFNRTYKYTQKKTQKSVLKASVIAIIEKLFHIVHIYTAKENVPFIFHP